MKHMHLRSTEELTWPLIALLLFVGGSALYGGFMLASDPTGQSLQMSTQLLPVGTAAARFHDAAI